ncbi:hypothetical protein TNIN_278301 [Trichonephila inaurata madagascariensis]|uniref:Uncharacterized protein n=1 Tax=Trichonephila inaurata madagascariensis TaxID=2747483 RepID=A0A8X6YXI9_9ARAC|nr:hypothetical protein TNIN_278301 [Trichonephila inaurata madagascariensis]
MLLKSSVMSVAEKKYGFMCARGTCLKYFCSLSIISPIQVFVPQSALIQDRFYRIFHPPLKDIKQWTRCKSPGVRWPTMQKSRGIP